VDEQAAVAAISGARSAGINFFDTAQAYGFGTSERILAAALASELRSRRDEIVLATKGGLRRTEGGLVRDASPAGLRRGVEESLRALNVDVIDLYQLHWPDPNTPIDESIGALRELVVAGKIRCIGVSNFDVGEMQPLERYDLPDTLQSPYNVFRRGIEEAILPYCVEREIGVFIYGPVAHGLLTGSICNDTTFDPADWRAHSPDFTGETLARNLDVVERLLVFAAWHGCTLPQLAIAWALANPGVDAAVVGARSPAHIVDAVGAVDVRLAADGLAVLSGVLQDAFPVHGPSPEAQPAPDGAASAGF
jgi:hypothetical protein